MNIGPRLIAGVKSFLKGVYSGWPISGWALKARWVFVRTKLKQFSEHQNILSLKPQNLSNQTKPNQIFSCSSSQSDDSI